MTTESSKNVAITSSCLACDYTWLNAEYMLIRYAHMRTKWLNMLVKFSFAEKLQKCFAATF